MNKKELEEDKRIDALWDKPIEDLTEDELELLRQHSDMGDPHAWNCHDYICDRCGNCGGTWLCDYCAPEDMYHAKATGKCKYFEKRPEDSQSQN